MHAEPTAYFPPRPFCPSCSSRDVSMFRASGRGTLASYVINHRPHPAWTEPYSIAMVLALIADFAWVISTALHAMK